MDVIVERHSGWEVVVVERSVGPSLTDIVLRSETSTAGINFVADEDTMVSDSDTKIPTQQSVKAYVDTNVPTTLVELDTTVTGTQLNTLHADALRGSDLIDEDTMVSNSATKAPVQQSVKAYVDTEVANSAATFSDVLRDSDVLDDDSFSTASATTVPTSESVKAYTDAAVVAGEVTQLTDLDTTVTGTQLNALHANALLDADVIDEDTMASNSATKVPTQQSVKTYVDVYGKASELTELDTTVTGAELDAMEVRLDELEYIASLVSVLTIAEALGATSFYSAAEDGEHWDLTVAAAGAASPTDHAALMVEADAAASTVTGTVNNQKLVVSNVGTNAGYVFYVWTKYPTESIFDWVQIYQPT